jgi:hypothetical protein
MTCMLEPTRIRGLIFATAVALVLSTGALADTTCNNLGGNTSCGDYSNCRHSASVVCGTLVATVTYTTTCRDGSGGIYEAQKIQSVLKKSKESVTNACVQALSFPESRLGRDL